jgi:hypothetical protein
LNGLGPGKYGLYSTINFINLGSEDGRAAVAKYCSTPDYTVDPEVFN